MGIPTHYLQFVQHWFEVWPCVLTLFICFMFPTFWLGIKFCLRIFVAYCIALLLIITFCDWIDI
jgi:hypothetical protein